MNCGECGKSRVDDMGRGREMLYCTEARRYVGTPGPAGCGKAVLGYGVHPAWCGVGIRRVRHGDDAGIGGASGAGVDCGAGVLPD